MAKNTIVLGINQTTMAALSMVTIAALIDAPGLGQVVLKAIEPLNIGVAFNAGLAIVIMAIVLDRVTTASACAPRRSAAAGSVPARWVRPVTYAVGIVLARLRDRAGPAVRVGEHVPRAVGAPHLLAGQHAPSRWFELHVADVTLAFSDWCTLHIIVPVTELPDATRRGGSCSSRCCASRRSSPACG